MEKELSPISEIIYVLPTSTKPIGALSFIVKTPVTYRIDQKPLEDRDGIELVISDKTLNILNELTASIIADLET